MSHPERLIIVGGGEHARVVADAACSRPSEWELFGFVDMQDCPEMVECFGLRQFQSDSEALELAADAYFVLGIGGVGSVPMRRRLADFYTEAGVRWACVLHDSAQVSPLAQLQAGTVVFAGGLVQTGACVGTHCIINTGAIVEHDCVVGDFNFIAPAAVIGGGTILQEDCFLGLGSRVRDHIHVGCGVTIGMGAVVTQSVTSGLTVTGVPARPLKNC